MQNIQFRGKGAISPFHFIYAPHLEYANICPPRLCTAVAGDFLV